MISLAWMMQQIKINTELDCDTSYPQVLMASLDKNLYQDKWGDSPYTESFKGGYRLLGH
jgi:hypothetical protein